MTEVRTALRVMRAAWGLLAAAAVLAVHAGSAAAATLSIDIPDAEVTTRAMHYRCGDLEVTVDYINAGSVSLAVLRGIDETIVASNVISGSGARYAGGRYIWWSKGDEALLEDLTKGADAAPVHCSTTG